MNSQLKPYSTRSFLSKRSTNWLKLFKFQRNPTKILLETQKHACVLLHNANLTRPNGCNFNLPGTTSFIPASCSSNNDGYQWGIVLIINSTSPTNSKGESAIRGWTNLISAGAFVVHYEDYPITFTGKLCFFLRLSK